MGLLSSDDDDDEAGAKKRGGFKTDDRITTTPAKRVIDEEAGVVIYAVNFDRYPVTEAGGYGLSAVPIEDTDLNLHNTRERKHSRETPKNDTEKTQGGKMDGERDLDERFDKADEVFEEVEE
jgi:hypothetical protein